MNDNTLFANWYLWLGVATVIILAAAVLLIMINLAAVRIRNLATAALGLVVEIKENTSGVWALQETNETACGILDEAKEIEEHITLVAHALKEIDQSRN